MHQKTYRQSYFCTSQPMNGAKSTSEKYCDELKIADAVPRSFVGNQAATKRPLPGKHGDKAKPVRNNNTNSTANAVLPCRLPVKPMSNTRNDDRKKDMP